MSTQPRESQKQDKRARILEAAVQVFAGRGFFNATVAEIARAAGVADGTIYLYFKSKDDLLLELFEEKMAELFASAQTALAEETSAPARLKRFIQHHLQAVEKNPELAAVLIVELRQSAQALRAAEKGRLHGYLDLIAQVVREGQEQGELNALVTPSVVKRAIFGSLDELALGWLRSARRTSLKKTAAEVAEWLVRGLLPLHAGPQGGKPS
jgi:TetR/AcrR family fatty acid metabolism transcriptional regulator